jgi:hypothetical protein
VRAGERLELPAGGRELLRSGWSRLRRPCRAFGPFFCREAFGSVWTSGLRASGKLPFPPRFPARGRAGLRTLAVERRFPHAHRAQTLGVLNALGSGHTPSSLWCNLVHHHPSGSGFNWPERSAASPINPAIGVSPERVRPQSDGFKSHRYRHRSSTELVEAHEGPWGIPRGLRRVAEGPDVDSACVGSTPAASSAFRSSDWLGRSAAVSRSKGRAAASVLALTHVGSQPCQVRPDGPWSSSRILRCRCRSPIVPWWTQHGRRRT